MSYKVVVDDNNEEVFVSNIETYDHRHEWYKIGKWVRCKTCTMELLDDDDTFLKVLKKNDSK